MTQWISNFIHQKSIFLYFLWHISILFSFWKALHRLSGFDIEPGPSPSLGPSQKIKPEPSKNGRAWAEPKPSLGLDPSLVTQGSKQYLGIKEYQERIWRYILEKFRGMVPIWYFYSYTRISKSFLKFHILIEIISKIFNGTEANQWQTKQYIFLLMI